LWVGSWEMGVRTWLGKSTALKVDRAKRPGMYADGAGLYLQVTSEGAKSWIYRFSLNGKAREMGLGSLSAIGLADARAKAQECRRLGDVSGGTNPKPHSKEGMVPP
jgi:hypothetical protein